MKMKKKDKIIIVLCLLWIGLVLYLKFNGEYTIERIEDLSELEVIKEENLILEYSIERNWQTLTEDELNITGAGERQKATLCILEDGSVYFLKTSQPILGFMKDNALPTITYSAYYMGRISTLDLLFIKCNRALTDSEAGYEHYPGYDPGMSSPQNSNFFDESESVNKKHESYTCQIYGIGEHSNKRVEASSNTMDGERWHKYRDANAIILVFWLRTTWHYQQYIDLMYQELYPWLVE